MKTASVTLEVRVSAGHILELNGGRVAAGSRKSAGPRRRAISSGHMHTISPDARVTGHVDQTITLLLCRLESSRVSALISRSPRPRSSHPGLASLKQGHFLLQKQMLPAEKCCLFLSNKMDK